MSSILAPEELRELRGSIEPRLATPRSEEYRSLAPAIRGLMDIAGIKLREWQYLALERASEIDELGQWLHALICLLVARQNGKSYLLIARIIAQLYLFGGLTLHTAADRALPRATFEELAEILEGAPSLAKRIKKIRTSNGTEEILLTSGARYRILAPTQEAFRGWSASLLVFDEAREQRDSDVFSAGLYTTRSMPNPQIWIASNAGDPSSEVLLRARERGLESLEDPSADRGICLLEWSADEDLDVEDPRAWIQANPSLGRGLRPEALLEELRTDDPARFRTEALCQWVATRSEPAVPLDAWEMCADLELEAIEPDPDLRYIAAIDIDPLRLEAAIVLGVDDGSGVLTVAVARSWRDENGISEEEVALYLSELSEAYSLEAIGFDPYTCTSLVERLEHEWLPFEKITGSPYIAACSLLWDRVANLQIRHPGDEYTDAQIESAGRRNAADGGWRIARTSSSSSIVAVVSIARVVFLANRPRASYEIL